MEAGADQAIDPSRLLSDFSIIYEIEYPELARSRYRHSSLGAGDTTLLVRTLRQDQYRERRDKALDQLSDNVDSISPRNLMSVMNQKIDEVNLQQKSWSQRMAKINGMSIDSIESSYTKYGLDPKKEIDGQILPEKIPRPETVFEVVLLQIFYLNQLQGLAYGEELKQKIRTLASQSEYALD